MGIEHTSQGIRLSLAPLKIHAYEPNHQPNLPLFAPARFS